VSELVSHRGEARGTFNPLDRAEGPTEGDIGPINKADVLYRSLGPQNQPGSYLSLLDREDPMPTYQIVVGFDGSEGAKKALMWAADETRARAGKMRVVWAWTPGEFGTDADIATFTSKKLDEEVHSLLGEKPGFDIELITDEGRAARVLLDRSADADMLVVGTRGHGGFAGLMLGSVGQQVTTHAGAGAVVIVK
jgi:nucleotide-binding universal stress UspA family protein